MKKQYRILIGIWAIFEMIAVFLWLIKGDLFYFLNFTYIGSCLAGGIFLYIRKWRYARNAVQFAIGLYMLFFLGVISGENMQIEGFWYYLFSGIFGGAVIHYAVAKIVGPLFFGRGWCGYGCWTAMLLDLFPYETRQAPRPHFGWIRYVLFLFSAVFALVLFALPKDQAAEVLFHAFLIGNILYYLAGIGLAFKYKDNRAFCKYVCPITVFLKPVSYHSVMKIRWEEKKCISCGACRRVCPMDVDMTASFGKRRNATECILCMKCVQACPVSALKL